MLQQFFLFFIFILLFLGCGNNNDKSNEGPLWMSESNFTSKSLYEIDSLIFSFHVDRAIILLDSIVKHTENVSLHQAALSRTRELKYQYVFLFDKVNVGKPNTLKNPAGFYENLRLNKTELSLDDIHSKLSQTKYHSDSTRLLIQLSIFHDEISGKVDSSHFYSLQAFLMNRKHKLNKLKFDAAIQLIRTSGFLRENTMGLAVSNTLINENKIIGNEDFYYFAKLNKANVYWRLGEFQLCLDELQIRSQSISSLELVDLIKITKLFAFSSLNDNRGAKKMISSLSVNSMAVESSNQVNTLRILGQHYFGQNNLTKAVDFLQKAKSKEESILFSSTAQYESILYLLSLSHEKLNEFETALEVYFTDKKSKNEEQYSPILVMNSNDELSYISVLRFADIHFSSWMFNRDTVQLINAIKLYEHANNLMKNTFKSLDENTVFKYFEYQTNMHEKLGLAYFDLYEKNGSPKDMKKSIEFLYQRNNLFLEKEYALNKTQVIIPKPLIDDKNNAQKNIKEALYKIDFSNDNLLDYCIELSNLETEMDRIKDQNSIENNRVNEGMNIQEIQSRIDDNTSVISYHIMSNKQFLVELDSESYQIHEVNISNTFLKDIEMFYRIQANKIPVPVSEYVAKSYNIFETLLPSKVYSELQENLIIIPDKQINLLNFESLVTSKNVNQVSFNDLDYLIKNKTINILPSEQFVWNKSEIKKAYKSKDFKIHAFSFSDIESIKLSHSNTELVGALNEVNFIEDHFFGSVVFKGKFATKDNFTKSLSAKIDHIHCGLHGMSSSIKRDNLKLYFRSKDYGLDSMMAYEILDKDIDCTSLFLSACQTGLGKYEEYEGLINLPRYFYMKGVKRIVYSLWNIDDLTTAKIIKSYYSNGLKLRQAKLYYLNTNKDKAHPYYWAGLVN